MTDNYEVTLRYIATVVVMGAVSKEAAIEIATEEIYRGHTELDDVDAYAIPNERLTCALACADGVVEAAP